MIDVDVELEKFIDEDLRLGVFVSHFLEIIGALSFLQV